ncbi:MAG: Flp family type IVb pilin [Actinomycetota bacterium]|jgi:Flp pilus assembly pilin Flp
MLLGLHVRVQAFLSSLRERIAGEGGAVATEYALLLLLIALAIVIAATALGTAIAGKFSEACTELGGTGC